MNFSGKRLQDLAPELVKVPAQILQPVGLYRIDSPRPFGGHLNETRIPKRLEMLRNSRSADWKPLGQLANRSRRMGQAFKNRSSGWVSQRQKNNFVSHDLP